VVVSDDPAERHGEGGDLSTGDRRSIDRHLEDCAGCRQSRLALEQALGALATAATSLPAPPDAPSLWPALEHRIKIEEARPGSRWFRSVRGILKPGVRSWAALDGERPLRSAWMRDSLREAMEVAGLGRGLALGTPRRHDGPRAAPVGPSDPVPGSRRRPVLAWRFGAATAALVLLMGYPAVHRFQADAQSTIRANAAPLAGRVVPPVQPESDPPAAPDPGDDHANPVNQLADVESVPAPDAPASGIDGTAASKAVAPHRFGYDLEHGIPMPPDARDSKPVY
jgi:hypothetical protein